MTDKQQAFLRLEELKKEMIIPEDFDPEKELMEGLEEKYGSISTEEMCREMSRP